MALTKCADCGRDVSTEALACPNCARPVRAGEKSAAGNTSEKASSPMAEANKLPDGCAHGCIAGAALLGLLGVFVFVGTLSPPVPAPAPRPKSSAELAAESRTAVADRCRAEVSVRLKAPATAEFEKGSGSVRGDRQRFVMDSYVDAQNAFGAKLRKRFTCVLEGGGPDPMRYQVKEVTLHGE